MPRAPAVSALAQQTIQVAFEDFEKIVTPADSRAFRLTTLQHVQNAALELESQMAARQALFNMRRLEPLLNGLEHYSHAIEVLCNGTPFLSWIWAPITLILRVASEYGEAFEQIMKGYSKIAGALGRFRILSHAFVANAEFQQTLAVFYADIIQFHKHAYKFVRRSGWRLLFLTSWGRFQRRFDNVLENLKRHETLIDQEANALNIAAASQMRHEIRTWREESLEQVKRDEERQTAKEFQSVISWLKLDETEQIQIFETISEEGTKFPGTCPWLLTNDKIKTWLKRKPESPMLWLQGNPGCGKSVIAAMLADFVKASKSSVIYHFCTYTYASSTKYDGILKSVLKQLLQINTELVAHVYQEYIVGKIPPTTTNLERLTATLIGASSNDPRQTQYMWIIIDGINECELSRQARLINLMNQISSISLNTGVVCKVLMTTRPSSIVARYFRKDYVIFLSDEASPLQSAIRMYVSQRLGSMHDRFRQLELEQDEIEEIGHLVSKKAGGMFLYARLVLDYVGANLFYDGDELKDSINQLPETLAEFYHKLLAQILKRLNEQSQNRVRCIFGWVAFAKRPLKKLEFLSALSFTAGNTNLTKLVPRYIVEDICSPLIEERRDTTLAFIHVSVKHYLQSSSSAVILREEDSLREHGIAAASCLLCGLQVFSKTYNEEEKQLRLIKGVHGFHVYATEYWTEYLLAIASTEGGLEGSHTLLGLTTRLIDALDEMFVVPPPKWKVSPSTCDDRLGLLHNYKKIQNHVERTLIARSRKQLESELLECSSNNKEPSATDNIPDGISIMLKSYQKTVESLLDQDSCPGASIEVLEFFKRQFRTSAYTCRLRSCPRATVGFESDYLRREHEIAHVGGFRCTFVGCQYPPFRSSKTLAMHVTSNHNHLITLPRQSIRKIGHLEFGIGLARNNDSTKRLRNTKHASTEVQSDTHVAPRSTLVHSNRKRPRSPLSSPREGLKNSVSGMPCHACSTRNVRCNNARPTCATCMRLSSICVYPAYCNPCLLNGLICDGTRPKCKDCNDSSTECSYNDNENCNEGYGVKTVDPRNMMSDSEQNSAIHQGPLIGLSTGETQYLESDLLGSSSISLGYLGIVLNEITGGALIDHGLFEQIKLTFTNDIHACWDLGEIADNLTAGLNDPLLPHQIISRLWAEYPEISKELRRFLPVAQHTPHDERNNHEIDETMEEVEDDDQINDDGTQNHPLPEFC